MILKDVAIYGVGSLVGRSSALISVPAYTRFLGLSEYGTLELLLTIISFSGIVLNLGMDAAQSHFYFKVEEKSADHKKILVGSILTWRIIWSIFLFLVAAVMISFFGNSVVVSSINSFDLTACLVIAAVVQVMSQGQELFRLTFQPWKFVIFGALYNGCHLALSICLLLYTDLGLYAVCLSLFVTSSIFAVMAWLILRKEVSFRRPIKSITWRRLLYFGGPISVGGVQIVLMNITDKWMLFYKLGPGSVAIYTIADKVVLIGMICVVSFHRAWRPHASKMISVSDLDFFKRSVSGYFGVATAGAVALVAAAPAVVFLLAPPEYSEATDYVAWLVWRAVFFGGYVVISIGFWKAEETASLPLYVAAILLLNVVLNYTLIDVFDSTGAAMATSISFGLWILLVGFGSERKWRVGFPVRMIFLQLVFGMSVVVILASFQRDGQHGSAVAIALGAVVVLCLSSLVSTSVLNIAHLRRFLMKRS